MWQYTVGRVTAMSSRPICLFIANNFSNDNASQNLAIAFLVTTLSMLGTSAGTHRRYYQLFFDDSKKNKTIANSLNSFIYSFFALIVIGISFILIMSIFKIDGAYLTLTICLYFVSEKLVDELLRFWLFEKKFMLWGKINLKRGISQICFTIFLVLLVGNELNGWNIVLLLAVCNLVFFLPMVDKQVWLVLKLYKLKYSSLMIKNTIKYLFQHRVLWAIALLGASVGYLERLLTFIIDEELLPNLMLVSMSFALIIAFVDFFYISRNRAEFLNNKITIWEALKDKHFLTSMLFGLIISGSIAFTILFYSKGGNEFSIIYVLLIASIQICLCLTSIPFQIVYWKKLLDKILKLELLFWSFLFITFTIWQYILKLSINLTVALTMVFSLILFRLISYIKLSTE